jgi:para-aminobenzoate synthetase/4-amino-4-deoxychorismate lyase
VTAPIAAVLDGRTIDPAEAAAIDPRGRDPVPLGIYETVLVTRDRPRLAAAHARRHATDAVALGLGAPTESSIVADMNDLAARAGGRRSRLRVIRWREDGSTRCLLTLSPEPPAPTDVVVGVAPERRPDGAVERRRKRIDAPDLDRVRAAAATNGRFDDLVLSEHGTVLEGGKTSVFWLRGRVLFTPAATLPILPGVRRARLLQAANRAGLTTTEITAPLDTVLAADEILLTNAIVGVLRSVRLRN